MYLATNNALFTFSILEKTLTTMSNFKQAKLFSYTRIMQMSRFAWHIKHQTLPVVSCLRYYSFCGGIYNYSNCVPKIIKCSYSRINFYFLFATLSPRIRCSYHHIALPNFSFNICFSPSKRTFSRTYLEFCKWDSNFEQNEEDLLSADAIDSVYEKWSRELLPVADRHSVFVIQPYIKWGTNKKRSTTPELQLAESVALVQSLHGWEVVDKMMIGLKSFEKKTFFGSGNYEDLKEKVCKNKRITAVFISTKTLQGFQHSELQSAFGVPVFDRYTIIIHLFHQHAVSREAKLQVAMAEIPYMWSKLRGVDPRTLDKRGGSSGKMGGGGETMIEIHKQVLVNRESKIKQALAKLRTHRQLLRSKRQRLEYPIVAVVGYTNSGKTSLIKALTGDESMEPKDQLFATLDISTHMGMLPSRLKVLYVDTIGFISDIPTNLLESFVATLEDALFADIILHVRDISHPDRSAQAENVNKTLQSMRLQSDVLNNIIVVGNKVDLVQSDHLEDNSCSIEIINVSATTFIGLNLLKKKIEETILQVTGRISLIIRVPMDGTEIRWLYKEAAVTHTEADPDNSQFLLMHVIISQAQLNKFRHTFIQTNCLGK